jgi:flagellar motor switch protein FliN/FliY
MTPHETREHKPLAGHEPARRLLDQWTESLSQVLESMTEVRPVIEWHPGSGAMPDQASAGGERLLWWEQPFRSLPQMAVWVGTTRSVWEHAGTVTLKAAGLEEVAEAEARNTWIEILGQSLGAMARGIGAVLGREIGCDAGVEREPEPHAADWAEVTLQFGEAVLPRCFLVLSPRLLAALASPGSGAGHVEDHAPEVPADQNSVPAVSRTMDLLLDVDLPVSISFGQTRLPLKDVLKLMTGSIVELNRGVNDPVDVLVNQCLVARGEVVVVEGNYGVRIQEIASRRDRLRSLR